MALTTVVRILVFVLACLSTAAEAAESLISRLPFPDGTSFAVSQGYDASRNAAPADRRWVVGLSVRSGTPVVAVSEGTVVEATATGDPPNAFVRVVLAHPDGLLSYYIGLPLVGVAVAQGRVLHAGDRIGLASGFLHYALVTKHADGGVVSQPVIFINGPTLTDYVEPLPGAQGVARYGVIPERDFTLNVVTAPARSVTTPSVLTAPSQPHLENLPRPPTPSVQNSSPVPAASPRSARAATTDIAGALFGGILAGLWSLFKAIWPLLAVIAVGMALLPRGRSPLLSGQSPNRPRYGYAGAVGHSRRTAQQSPPKFRGRIPPAGSLDETWDEMLVRWREPENDAERYEAAGPTPTELDFYKDLERAVEGVSPAMVVHPQTAMGGLIQPRNQNEKSHWGAIAQQRVDFTVTLKDHNHAVLAIIELDDWSHDLPGKKAKDAQRDRRLEEAGLTVIRWRCEVERGRPTVEKIREALTAPALINAAIQRG